MKKTIFLTGVFAFVISTPFFAQEQKTNSPEKSNTKATEKVEKYESNTVKPELQKKPVQTQEVKTIEPNSNQELKSTESRRKKALQKEATKSGK